jgi:hypothetical protein
MKLLYLDNNALIYLFERCNRDDLAVYETLTNKQELRPVVSLNNLLEICQSPSKAQALSLATYIDAMNVLWLEWYLDVQRSELTVFLASSYFNCKVESYSPICKSLSQLFYDGGTTLPLGLTATSFVESTYGSQHVNEFAKKHTEHAAVLKLNQIHRARGDFTEMVETRTLNNYLVFRIPDLSPGRTKLSLLERRDIIKFCLKNRSTMYKLCPSIAAEFRLSDYRSSNVNRKPRRSDSEDLLFACVALPYVDYLVTNDGYLKAGLCYVKKLGGLTCNIYRKVSEIKCGD